MQKSLPPLFREEKKEKWNFLEFNSILRSIHGLRVPARSDADLLVSGDGIKLIAYLLAEHPVRLLLLRMLLNQLKNQPRDRQKPSPLMKQQQTETFQLFALSNQVEFQVSTITYSNQSWQPHQDDSEA